jgi:dihydrofolate reductase
MPCVAIVVACDPRYIIGSQGKLPWRLPEDLQLFRNRTMGHAVIMGRKTWDGLPERYKPLDGRANVVISKTKWFEPTLSNDGPYYYDRIDKAIEIIRRDWTNQLTKYKNKDIYIIGGAQIYQEALDKNLVDKIYMSRLDDPYEGDVRFPVLGPEWNKVHVEPHKKFNVFTWERK